MPNQTSQGTDLDEITALYASYGQAFDTADADAYVSVFTEGGRFILPDGKVLIGHDRLRRLVTVATGRPGQWHHFARNITLDLRGDTARGAAHVVAVHTTDDGVELMLVGSYRDSLAKVEGRWLFSERVAEELPPIPPG